MGAAMKLHPPSDIIEERQLMRFGIILELDAVALERRCCFGAE